MSGFEFLSKSEEATLLAGRLLGEILRAGDCLALSGELGAGKTHLSKAVASALGVSERVVSPSFNLLLEYSGRVRVRHLDAYFASREAALLDEACGEVFGPDGVAIVEWAEKVDSYLPSSRLAVTLEVLDAHSRRIRVDSQGARGSEIATQWGKALQEKDFKIQED